MYAKGEGVIQDNVYAHMWWNIAASSGYADAKNNKGIITKRIGPAQVSEAQSFAR
jgi:TPR repeat protein